MVCEIPRTRQLLLRKKGSFFEDPFFSDVWDDYNHAVRRIVDRFNRGWVSPSDRLRDSQYHSMYRTLRSARLNYSTQSARFKEEGNVYKLVMDVREFIGGDITVRTAGGTVSVRGKMEMNADEESKKTIRDDNDDGSTVSGKSTSAKTLHRRFTLPADADCEKIESSLSRDAVLTVTIPKRSDVHYIPVNIESEDNNKENESLSAARGAKDSVRQPGIKRPSDTASEPNRKKSQDESVTYRRKYKQENNRGEDDKEERRSRRRSKDYDPEDKSKSKLDNEKENATKDEINGKRIKRNSDLKDTPNSGFRKREKSIYEEVQEINIPVRIDKNEPSDKVFRPSSVHEPVIHNIEIQRDSNDCNQESDIEMEKETSLYKDRKHNESPVKVDLSTRPKYSVLENSVDPLIEPLKLNVRRNENCEDEKITKSQLFRESSNTCHRNSSKEREDDKTANKLSLNKNLDQVNGVSETKAPSTIDHNGILDKRHSIPSIDIKTYGLLNEEADKTESENKDIGKKYFGKIDSNKKLLSNISSERTKPETEEKGPKLKSKLDDGEVNGFNCKLKDKLEAPKSSLVDRPASPISPGSRVVKVEEDSSLMEEGMFKDCWSDFSNTLQDVLSRLQELSSELSQSKILAATTPSAESSPPIIEKGWADETHSKNEPEASLDLPPKDNPSLNKATFAHRPKIDVGGVGGSEGGAKDDNRSAHFPWRSGHGRNETRNLDADGQSDSHKETTQATQKLQCLPNNPPSVSSLNDKINKSFKSERPFSLPLRNVASPQRKFVPQEQGEESSSPLPSRPSSIYLTDATPGSLLESLRKNSPVESLQEDFLRRTCLSESSERKGNYVPVEVDEQRAVPVGGQRKEEERSVSLSPSDSQSNVELVGSESESGTSCALENTQDSNNSKTCASYKVYGDSDKSALPNKQRESPFKNKSLLNDLSTSNPSLQQVSKDDSTRNLVFEPNIDTSPESNLTDESECSSPEEGIVRGHFSFPAVGLKVSEREVTVGRPQRGEDYKAFSSLADVIGSSDVTESKTCANENLPKIPSDDEMVCERPLPPSPRGPRRDAKQEPLRFSRINRPRDLLLQEVRGDVEGSREPNGEMGGVLSKGRKAPSRVYSEALSESPTTKSPSSYSSSPSRKATKQPLPPEEPSIPPYVRLRSEPTKRYSGFAHVNSDNVRRMRDVWGPKPETVPPQPPQTPPRSSKVPPSPTKTSSRRSSDATERRSPARTQRSESPRVGSYPSPEKSSFPFNRSSPSPDRGYSSPSYQKYSKNKVCKESPPPSPKYTNSSSKPSTPSYSSYTRKGSQVGQDRSSPVPSSPCRRCSRGAKESPSPSPSVESRKKFNYESRVREENPRSKPSSSTSSPRKEYTDSKKPQPKEEAPKASKVHQKIFRRLRDANLQPNSEAICFKEEADKYKMVLDVEEYVPGEVEVLQDDLVLTVKGRVERRDPGGHVSVKTFDRKFNIPKNSREEEIDSALSNDGILTIYVPKKRERVIKIELVD